MSTLPKETATIKQNDDIVFLPFLGCVGHQTRSTTRTNGQKRCAEAAYDRVAQPQE